MDFAEFLGKNAYTPWSDDYLDYHGLVKKIREVRM
jgi:SPX domain protein involved in polyphosphate accumulation